MTKNKDQFGELTELHVHVGSAVDPPIMWEIAHDQGIRLPTKSFWEFEKLITVSGKTSYDQYLELFHWTELIQSSPEAIEKSVYSIASGAYRKNNITTLEIRFNPMKRNRGGERDLDHIILSAIHGMEKAMIAFPIKVGLILMFDRTFSANLNTIIGEKAIKYRKRGVVGVDLAGPIDKRFTVESIAHITEKCAKSGLGVTIHTGEATNTSEMWQVVKLLKPDRIGHGIKAARDKRLLETLARKKIVLEICPTSNIHTQVVKNWSELAKIFKSLKEYKVPFTINTDGPEMLVTNLVSEFSLLIDKGILTKKEIKETMKTAKEGSFIK